MSPKSGPKRLRELLQQPGIIIEAPETRAELEEIARRVKHPLFVNMHRERL